MDTLTTNPVDYAALDRLGDEIAELSAHLEAATASLLDLIREFDARGGWNNGFTSCAAWLSGASVSIWARPANGCAWRGPWSTCRGSPTRLPAASSRTPRYAR
jgi:hypothetical protein